MEFDLFSWAEQQTAVVEPRLSEPAQKAPVQSPVDTVENRGPELSQARTLLTLRDYQEVARKDIHAAFLENKRQMAVLPTGAGKTVLFAAITADFHPQRVLILTDQYDLVDQAVDKIHKTTGIFADVEQSDRTASPHAKVVVATVQTLKGRLAKYPPDHFALVICDECDRSVAAMWQVVLKHFDGHAKILGVTATPKRADKKNILNYFAVKSFEITMRELIDRGYLAPVMVQEANITMDLTDVQTKGSDFDADQLSRAVVAIFGEVCGAIKQFAPKRKILVFTPDRATSRQFVVTCHKHGLTAQHVDGESKDREQIKRAFRDWTPTAPKPHTFQILCNPLLLGRGFDDPSIDCVINLRPTQSLALYQQIIGRGTRIHCPHGCGTPCDHEARKRDLLVLDFLYQFKSLGPVRPSMLMADTEAKAKKMTEIMERTQGMLDLRELERLAERDIQMELVAAMLAAQTVKGKKQGEYFNAFQWAASLDLPDLTDYEPSTPAEAGPPKKGTMTKLRNAGFIEESITCHGHAESILAVITARREAGLASFKQVFWLRKFGFKDPENFTRDQAERTLTIEFAKRPRK